MSIKILFAALALAGGLNAEDGTADPLRPSAAAPTSPYGHVGAWNWEFSAIGTTGPTVTRDPRYSYGTRLGHSVAMRFGLEKVLARDHASRVELSLGDSEVRLFYGGFEYMANRIQSAELALGHRMRLDGPWMPEAGWTPVQGPWGRPFRPTLDMRLSVVAPFRPPDVYWLLRYDPIFPRGNARILVPVVNGLRLLGELNVPLVKQDYADLRTTQVPTGAMTTFMDLGARYTSAGFGAELAWPRTGVPTLGAALNPDGEPYSPSLAFTYRSLHADYWRAGDLATWALKLPMSGSSTAELVVEHFEPTPGLPAIDRIGLSWKAYGKAPEPLPTDPQRAQRSREALRDYRRPGLR